VALQPAQGAYKKGRHLLPGPVVTGQVPIVLNGERVDLDWT